MKLTKGQEKALEEVKKGNNVFITGGGGVGKSFLIERIVKALRPKQVLLSASTGKAATLIGGTTCHRLFDIPLDMAWKARVHIYSDSPLHAADVILIDEISMLRLDVFTYIIRSIGAINEIRERGNAENKKRNPIQLIVLGDFCQLPPVIRKGSKGEVGEKEIMRDYYGYDIGQGYAFLSPAWKECNFVTVELTEAVRQSNKDFIKALNQIRMGDREGIKYITEHSRKKPFPSSEKGVIYLCGTNATADGYNLNSLAKIKGTQRIYRAKVEGEVGDQDKTAPDMLKLKIGAQVIMLQNSSNYTNGQSGIITKMMPESVEINFDGHLVEVGYAKWDVKRYILGIGEGGAPKIEQTVIGSFYQLPLRLGYAITIHKSQGQTYDKVTIVLTGFSGKKEIFTEGQFYVAVSRVKDVENMYLKGDTNVKLLASDEVVSFCNEELTSGKKKTSPQKPKDSSAEKMITLTCPDKEIYSMIQPFIKDLSENVIVNNEKYMITFPERYKPAVKRYYLLLEKYRTIKNPYSETQKAKRKKR